MSYLNTERIFQSKKLKDFDVGFIAIDNRIKNIFYELTSQVKNLRVSPEAFKDFLN